MRQTDITILKVAFCAALALSSFSESLILAQSQGLPTQEWEDLENDQSRTELAEYDVRTFGTISDKSVRRSFYFPDDAGDGLYGIDVSHHNGSINWSTVAKLGVKFAYLKASQGTRYRDKTFVTNWAGAKANGVARGAYHFLSAGVPGKDQAQSFLAILKASGGLDASDLVPVVDVEWDMETVNGVKVDRWAKYSAAEIVKVVQEWMQEVTRVTGRHPIIYTAASWWNPRVGANESLRAYAHWLADYRTSSIQRGKPASVNNHRFVVWQFTDAGRLSGGAQTFDINHLRSGKLSDLVGQE